MPDLAVFMSEIKTMVPTQDGEMDPKQLWEGVCFGVRNPYYVEACYDDFKYR